MHAPSAHPLRLLTLLALCAAGPLGCGGGDGPNPNPSGNGTPDAGTLVPTPDGSTDPGPDGGGELPDGGALPDGGYDGGVQPEGPPLAAAQCFELEAAALEGTRSAYPAAPETVGGTVVLGASSAGNARLPFTLDADASLRVWLRARAPTPSNNGLSVSLDAQETSASATWDIPVTPVLRWQQVTRRGNGTAVWPAQPQWPHTVAGGAHTLVLTGLEPGVELDALCLMPPGQEPPERFASPPLRNATVSLAAFGAAGDGVTDDTAALQAALASLVPGDALYLPPGRYRFTQKLNLATGGVTVMGEGTQSVLFADLPASTPSSEINAFNVEGPGPGGTSHPLLQDGQPLSRTVVVAATAEGPFAVGDTVHLRSDDWGVSAPNNVGAFFRNRAALARVVAVETRAGSRFLTLDRPLLGPFYVATNSRVERFNGLREVVLARFALEGSSRPTPTDNADLNLLGLKHCDRCFVSELSVKYARKAAIDLFRTLDVQVIAAQVSDATDTGGDGHGYGVTLSRSQGGVVRSSLFTRVLRHGIPISWGSRESFIFRNQFDRSVPHTNNIASIDLHGQDDYANLIEGNQITGGQPGIIVGGGGTTHGNDGPWNVVRDNSLVDTVTGISVNKSTYDTIIEGNVTRRTNAPGLELLSGSDRTRVWRNHIESYLGSGLNVSECDGVEVFNNTFLTGTGPAVNLRDSMDYTVQFNWLNGQLIQHPGTGTASPNY